MMKALRLFAAAALAGVLALRASANVEAPVFSPPPGSYQTAQEVTVTCGTPGAEIRYTTDGSIPDGSSTLYASPVEITQTTMLSAIGLKEGLEASEVVSGTYRIDAQAPTIHILTISPSQVREGTDKTLTIVASATDEASGGSAIAQAEWFAGADPGEGNGTAMDAADGAFDAALELCSAEIDVSSWAKASYHLSVRARDAADNWGSVDTRTVNVVEGVAPGAITDLAAVPLGSLMRVTDTIYEFSSQSAVGPVSKILDGDRSTFWQTQGTTAAETEYITLNLFADVTIEAVQVSPALMGALFPREFEIQVSETGVDWTTVARAKDFKVSSASYLWQFEPLMAQYVRISGPGVYNRGDGKYYWQIADMNVYAGGGSLVSLSWTAPADDGYIGDTAKYYDCRVSQSEITEANFESCSMVSGLGAPKPALQPDGAVVETPFPAGPVYIAMKTADEVFNWSALSNAVSVGVYPTGFLPVEPDDWYPATADEAPDFQFEMDPAMSRQFIGFSSSPDFVRRPTERPDGQVDRTIRFPFKPGSTLWTPTPTQWKAIKKIACSEGALYWRLEAAYYGYLAVYSPTRSIFFESGEIIDITPSPSHIAGGGDALWPDKNTVPSFSWIDLTDGMKYFFVDVSTDPTMPLKDQKRSVTLGGRGVEGEELEATKAEWKTVRRLATWLKTRTQTDPAEGTLYWRVRALDADRVLSCGSAVATLLIDGGTWSVGDIDFGSTDSRLEWTHSGQGIEKYRIEFSISDEFNPTPKETLTVPARSLAEASYVFKAGEVSRLKKFAAHSGVSALYYRIRGEDADKAFMSYSGAKTASMP